jgi:uncharacterized membrane protein YfcA
MPQNKLLYLGLLIVAAAALIYVGAWLTAKIEFAVPYAIGVGAIMIIAGLVMESKKKKAAAEESTTSPAPPTP